MANAMEVWLWTLEYLQNTKDANGKALYHGQRQGVSFALADALCWLVASYYQILDVLELKAKGPENPTVAEGIEGYLTFFSDISYLQAARAAGESSRVCAELVYGFKDSADTKSIKEFAELRATADAAIAGARLAKDRAGEAIAQVMIPEALDYPL